MSTDILLDGAVLAVLLAGFLSHTLVDGELRQRLELVDGAVGLLVGGLVVVLGC